MLTLARSSFSISSGSCLRTKRASSFIRLKAVAQCCLSSSTSFRIEVTSARRASSGSGVPRWMPLTDCSGEVGEA
jgi:hypothetical protein